MIWNFHSFCDSLSSNETCHVCFTTVHTGCLHSIYQSLQALKDIKTVRFMLVARNRKLRLTGACCVT
jgi:hypothetical protein